ncbi:MAG: ATP-binding protein [Gammaproteobacteria bacterium]|nr:MAG: ATP-binding protein [Gammaproteobacteria bacterium]
MKVVELLRSSSFRLSFIYMILFAGSVLILLGFIYWSTVGYMSAQTDATIKADITGLAEQYSSGGLNKLVSIITDRIERDPDSALVYLFASADYTPLAGNLDSWPKDKPSVDGWMNFEFADVRADNRIFQARARPFTLQGGLLLLVGRDTRELRATQQLIIKALVWGIVMTLVFALAGGIIMSRSMLKSIDRINRVSREILAGDMQQRIETKGSNDEFDQLAVNLNAMLDEIDRLMTGIREVTDNVAHDLRTPLTRLRTRLEHIHAGMDEDNPDINNIEQTITDADQMLASFGALLRIARIEAGGLRENFEKVDLAELIRDAGELYDVVAGEKQITFDIQLDVSPIVDGDRDLLFQAIINLLDNAIKYSPQAGHIALRLYRDKGHVVLKISDSGPGIPTEERENVVQRFYRMDKSRTLPGSGLGLSLVAAVAVMHDAELVFSDSHPGLIAELRFQCFQNNGTSLE